MPSRTQYADLIDTFADMVAERVLAKMGTAATPEGKLLSIKDAAALMGVSEKALRHQITTDDFPEKAIRRFGRRILIERELFTRWLAAH